MSSCDDILKEINASKEEIAYVKAHIKDGEATPTLVDKFIQNLKNKEFRKDNNNLSMANTKSFQEKLYDVVQTAKKPYNVLFNFLVGETSGITSRALARAHARFGYFSSRLRMGNGDIKKLLNDQVFVKDFLREMENFGTRKTNNKLAHELAEAVTEYQKKQVLELNSFGGGVFWRDDYITKQWHDSYRMLKAGKDKWVNDVYLALDHVETKNRIRHILIDKGITFDEKKFNLRKYLGSAYKNMTVKSSKSGLLLDSLHLKRTLKFKDTPSFMLYNKFYGHENVAHAVFENMTMMDNHIAFGEAFGFGYRKKVTPDAVTLKKFEDELVVAKEGGEKSSIEEAQNNFDNIFFQLYNYIFCSLFTTFVDFSRCSKHFRSFC